MTDKVIKVKRGNVVLRIDEEKLKEYIGMGYRQFNDKTGELIGDETPQLTQDSFNKLQKTIEAQKKEIESLSKAVKEKDTESNLVNS